MKQRFAALLRTASGQWLSFRDPVLVLQADSPDAVHRTLDDVEHLTRDRGLHAVGFITYEAAGAFGVSATVGSPNLPLVWFGLYETTHVEEVAGPASDGTYQLGPVSPSIDQATFTDAVGRIKHHLAEGDTYQVNFTFRLHADFTGDPQALFADLWVAQRGEYSAFLDLGNTVICSVSPELFFAFEGADIVSKPMKGTAPRGLSSIADQDARDALLRSPKNRAENVMIVDMMRNDLGRIAEVGTVSVPKLFTVERYPNVWQMTSEVRARTMAPLADVVSALHPAASITGAPKPRTTAIIAELETTPRGVYTGAIGHVPPDGLARFSVAIRTAVVDRTSNRLSFGVGAGIVWDSDAGAEYDECLLKGAMLGRLRVQPIELLETLKWTPGAGFALLELHLRRLANSAEYFEIVLEPERVRDALAESTRDRTEAQRVRLCVRADGQLRVETTPVVPEILPLRVTLAQAAIDPSNVLLYHKTTTRSVYDEARASAPGYDDVLLWNPTGELTEATVSNVVVELEGVRVTPPVSCGLLPGTGREDLLARGEVIERIVRIDDLPRATGIWLVNSVRGLRPAVLG